MFICKMCLDYGFDNWAPLSSHGRCEMCHAIRSCADIHHSNLIDKPKPKPDPNFQVVVFRTVMEKHVVEVMAKDFKEASQKAEKAITIHSRKEASEITEVNEIKVIHPPKGKNG